MEDTKNQDAIILENKLSEVDRLTLELAKADRKLAQSQAETALAKNEATMLAYKYVVLQLYMKYNLTEHDAITDSGEIVRGGALKTSNKS